LLECDPLREIDALREMVALVGVSVASFSASGCFELLLPPSGQPSCLQKAGACHSGKVMNISTPRSSIVDTGGDMVDFCRVSKIAV